MTASDTSGDTATISWVDRLWCSVVAVGLAIGVHGWFVIDQSAILGEGWYVWPAIGATGIASSVAAWWLAKWLLGAFAQAWMAAGLTAAIGLAGYVSVLAIGHIATTWIQTGDPMYAFAYGALPMIGLTGVILALPVSVGVGAILAGCTWLSGRIIHAAIPGDR